MEIISRRALSVFLPSLVVACWLGMMLVHESGHMLAALATGGTVQRLVFHPLCFSRTDVVPNPHPLAVTWGGPVFGVLFPSTLLVILRAVRRRCYAVELFAAFGLLANGAYIGFGSFIRAGDGGDLLRCGSPLWLLWLFGAVALAMSFVVLHQQGGRLGFPTRVRRLDVWIAVIGAVVLLVLSLMPSFAYQP